MTKLFSIDIIALPLLVLPIQLAIMLLLQLQLYTRTKRRTDLLSAIPTVLATVAALQPYRWADGREVIFWSTPFQWAVIGVLFLIAGNLYLRKAISRKLSITFSITILCNLIAVTFSPSLAVMVAAAGFAAVGFHMIRECNSGDFEDTIMPYLLFGSGAFALIGHWIPYNGGRFLFGLTLVVILGYELSRFFSRVIVLLQTASMNSLTDGLTGLYNKSFLFRKANLLAEQGEISIIFADIDDFKQLNDTKGHEVGDDVLRTTGAILRETLGKQGYACRFGGEELVGIVYEGDPTDLATRFCEKVNKETMVTVSVGVASGSGDGGQIIRQADERMYEAKRSGKNKVVAV